MPTNTSGQYTADIEQYIANSTLELTRRQLVAYQFGDPETLPKGRGVSWTATRFNRIPLPFQSISEGIPPVGEQMNISQVTVVLQQWGDRINMSDVAEMTIKHPVLNEAKKLLAIQTAETTERNTFNGLMGLTQVNYVNQRGSRGALVTGDVLNTFELSRAFVQLVNLGAPRFLGDEVTDAKIDARRGGAEASANPRGRPHYVGICHPFVEGDLTQNSTFVLASSYSDVNKLYNYEVGQWHGLRFCSTNMCPYFVGAALITGTPGTSGNLATAATYNIIVTQSDWINQYETIISQISGNLSVTGPTGSIAVTLPAVYGYTYNVYIGSTATVQNLALCAAGPTTGPLQGQATQLQGGQTVTLTGIGLAQTPPAAPQTGVTVYPTFIIGRGAYAQVVLDDIKVNLLTDADKSDPLNQQRVIGWLMFYGFLIKNNLFAMRIESASAFNTVFG